MAKRTAHKQNGAEQFIAWLKSVKRSCAEDAKGCASDELYSMAAIWCERSYAYWVALEEAERMLAPYLRKRGTR